MNTSMEEEALFVNEEVPKTDDPIVSEIPVYLNNQAGDNLVLFQYPTRKSNQTNKISAVRLKPATQTVEADIETDLPSSYINEANGSQIMGTKQTYSGVLNANEGRFAAGYIHNNALHLSLVPRTGQLRPQFASKSSTLLQPSMLQAPGQNRQQNNQGTSSSLKDVQYSVKPTSTEGPKHSGVLDFWRQANKEKAETYACSEISDSDKLAIMLAPEDKAQEVVQCEDVGPKMNFLK